MKINTQRLSRYLKRRLLWTLFSLAGMIIIPACAPKLFASTWVQVLSASPQGNGATISIVVYKDTDYVGDGFYCLATWQSTAMSDPKPYPGDAPHGYVYSRNVGAGQGNGTQHVHTEAQPYSLGYQSTTFSLPATGKEVAIEQYWGPGAGFSVLATWNPASSGTGNKVAHLRFTNRGSVPVKYKVLDGLVEIDAVTCPALTLGDGMLRSYLIPNDHTLSVVSELNDYSYSDGIWVEDTGTTITYASIPATGTGSLAPASAPGPAGSPGFVGNATSTGGVVSPAATPPTTNNVPQMPNVPTGSVPGAGSGNVWAAAPPGDGLTNAVYRQGVDRQTDKADKQLEKLTSLVAHNDETKTNLVADKAASAANTVGVVQELANTKMALARTAYAAALGTTGIEAGATGGTTTSLFAVTFPGGETIDYAPWSNPSTNLMGNILKAFLTALVLTGFGWFMLSEVQKNMATLVLAPQTRGNTVAGTGGQVTGLIGAAVITVILLGTPVLLAALADNGLGWKTINSLFAGVTSVGGVHGQAVVDLFYFFLPMATILAALAQAFFVRTTAMTIMGAAAMAIRWVVPGIIIAMALGGGASDAFATVRMVNSSGQSVDVGEIGMSAVTIAPGGDYDLPPASGSTFDGVLADGTVFTFEALDESNVVIRAGGVVQVAVPSRAWVALFMKGFIAGMVMEVFGLSFRLFGRIGGSQEVP